MISRRFARYPRKPNFRARAQILACGITWRGATQLFSYLGYYFFYYLSERYHPLPAKAERDSRTACSGSPRRRGPRVEVPA